MRTLTITELAVPVVEEVPRLAAGAAVQGWHDVGAQALVAAVGHDDFMDPPVTLAASYADQKHLAKVLLLAVAGPSAQVGDPAEVLGTCWLGLPRTDNTHLAMVDLAVRPAERGHGVGSALWQAAERHIRAVGRDTATTWTLHRAEAPAGDPDALTAPTGVGRLPGSDPAVRFALARGFTLEQTERQSTLRLPVDRAALATWRAEAAAVAGPDYRLVQWVGATPAPYLAGMAELQRRMSLDAPSAGVDFREEVWTPERVRDSDEEADRRGHDVLVTAAEHRPTGALVAFTQLALPRARPAVVYQDNTLVHGEHRGRRLGLAVKAANLDQLARVRPQARRVHTWNAGENRYMLAINVRLGFRPASVEGAWQRRLT